MGPLLLALVRPCLDPNRQTRFSYLNDGHTGAVSRTGQKHYLSQAEMSGEA